MVERGGSARRRGGGFYQQGRQRRSAPSTGRRSSTASGSKAQVRLAWRRPQHVAGPRARACSRSWPARTRPAQFLWRVLSATCFYAASLVPEISDDVVSIDRAMEWGYGWGLGPFRSLDALGVAARGRARAGRGPAGPAAGRDAAGLGPQALLRGRGRRGRPSSGPAASAPVPERAGRHRPGGAQGARRASRRRTPGASLVDLGDGCGLVEFHSKMNTLGADTFAMLHAAVKEGASHFDALVVGNQGEQFTRGRQPACWCCWPCRKRSGTSSTSSIRQFQSANMALKYARRCRWWWRRSASRWAAAARSRCTRARVRASAETYMGLVEVGVGLVPGGGGTKEMALRALDRCAGRRGRRSLPVPEARLRHHRLRARWRPRAPRRCGCS